MIIDLFFPCRHDGFSEQQRADFLKIISLVGDRPSDLPMPFCCGQHAHLSGYPLLAKTYGENFLRNYEENRPLVCVSTSCMGYMINYYAKFFFNTSLHNELKQFQSNVVDLSQYLVSVKKVLNVGAKFEGNVAYYKSAIATEKCALKNEVELLLEQVDGLSLVDYTAESCCGDGALFASSFPEHAEKLALFELQKMMDKDAHFVTSTDAHCLNHFKAVIEKHKFSIKTIHLVEILASGN